MWICSILDSVLLLKANLVWWRQVSVWSFQGDSRQPAQCVDSRSWCDYVVREGRLGRVPATLCLLLDSVEKHWGKSYHLNQSKITQNILSLGSDSFGFFQHKLAGFFNDSLVFKPEFKALEFSFTLICGDSRITLLFIIRTHVNSLT